MTRFDRSEDSRIQLSLTNRSSGSRSPSLRSLSPLRDSEVRYSESDVDFNGEMDDLGGDFGSYGDSAEHTSVFTDVSDDSGTSARQYKWRKRLQARKRSSLSRHQHTSAGTAPRLKEIASSLPDLGLYKTWDPRTTLKVSTRVHFASLLLQPRCYH